MSERDSINSGESGPQSHNLPAVIPQQPENSGGGSWFGRAFRTLFGWKPASLRANLRESLDAAPDETGFSPEESRMLKNILGLRERRLQDIMVPRADIVAIQQDISLGELMRVFESAGHSRLVVYNDTLDDPIGMVHIRDLIAFMTRTATPPADKIAKRKRPLPAGLDLKTINLALPLSSTKIVREIIFVPPSMRLIDLLAQMQATRVHLSLVIDEYGGTDGLVTIEDLVEEIVGEIADEHDEDIAPDIVRQPDGSFVADARTPLDQVTAVVGDDFVSGDAAHDVDTLGGYLISLAGRLPARGELIAGPGLYEIEVAEVDPRRIKRVRIYKLKERRERPRRGVVSPPIVESAPLAADTKLPRS
ncbi:MAG: Magnesium and cobalt efflux protein CorC [Pseudolabrys sp.]|jgi:CBS domain containing-hemolysin-like protein|nr:Magnesium and cobalt efflux protein CorC [Pseudolabrys sp.]